MRKSFSLLGVFLDEAEIGDEAYFQTSDKTVTAMACRHNARVVTVRIRAIERNNSEVVELTKVKLIGRGFRHAYESPP